MRADPPDPAPQDAGTASVPAPGTLPAGLARWLAAAGISDLGDPLAAWCRLRAAEGLRATGIDLYWLAGSAGLYPTNCPGMSGPAWRARCCPCNCPDSVSPPTAH